VKHSIALIKLYERTIQLCSWELLENGVYNVPDKNYLNQQDHGWRNEHCPNRRARVHLSRSSSVERKPENRNAYDGQPTVP